MPKIQKKNCFPMPAAKNGFQILKNLHPKNIYFQNKNTRLFNAYKVKKKNFKFTNNFY